MMRLALLALPVLMLALSPAHAQQRWVQFASGTGFFINPAGDLITNAHVVNNCQSITLRLPGGEKPATIIARDTERDLAVLRTGTAPPAIAPLRWNIRDLKIGDTLYLYGFPGQAGAAGTPSFVRTTLSEMHGPTGQPQWLQLASVAQKGNSGGPVLDGSGNVIAVITGRAETYRVAKQGRVEPQLVGKSDIAITLASLQDFLHSNRVSFYQYTSGAMSTAEPVIRGNAAKFVASIRCLQGTIVR